MFFLLDAGRKKGKNNSKNGNEINFVGRARENRTVPRRLQRNTGNNGRKGKIRWGWTHTHANALYWPQHKQYQYVPHTRTHKHVEKGRQGRGRGAREWVIWYCWWIRTQMRDGKFPPLCVGRRCSKMSKKPHTNAFFDVWFGRTRIYFKPVNSQFRSSVSGRLWFDELL